MNANRYLALLASDRKPLDEEERIYMEILNYLDDRNWPVRVWYHNRLPVWIRGNIIFSNLFYAIHLALMPRLTMIVDYRLYSHLAAALSLVRKITTHGLIVYVRDESHQKERLFFNSCFWLSGIRCADLVVVDSYQTRTKLVEQGLNIENIRILHPTQTFLPLIYRQQLFGAESISFEFEDVAALFPQPATLAEAFEQLDLESTLLPQTQKPFC